MLCLRRTSTEAKQLPLLLTCRLASYKIIKGDTAWISSNVSVLCQWILLGSNITKHPVWIERVIHYLLLPAKVITHVSTVILLSRISSNIA